MTKKTKKAAPKSAPQTAEEIQADAQAAAAQADTDVEPIGDEPTKPAAADTPDDFDSWEHASSLIWQPEPNDALIGVYDGSAPFTEGSLETEVNKHFVVDQENTRWSFVGGSSFDKIMETADIKPGYMIAVKYLGKKDLQKEGRRVNLFDVRYKKP